MALPIFALSLRNRLEAQSLNHQMPDDVKRALERRSLRAAELAKIQAQAFECRKKTGQPSLNADELAKIIKGKNTQ